ncbi:hypothetical protein [Lactobacillus sp. PSON]|uniref:hypothetical protein n=1 Tax=Lactobacillus sp. PSON TaxID=3455454 RepID=UPI0040439456
MTNQDRKKQILNRLRAIIYLVLGITVLFLSIQSIAQSNGKLGTIFINFIWLFLSLIIIIESGFVIKNILLEINPKKRLFQLSDWCIIIAGIIITNAGYINNSKTFLLIGIVIFIAGCIPIKEIPIKK